MARLISRQDQQLRTFVFRRKTKKLKMSDVIKPAEKGSMYYNGKISCSYKWTIFDFKSRTAVKGDSLLSDTFEIYEPNGRISNWHLHLYPKGDNRTQDEDLSLYLFGLNHFEIKISFTLSILDASTGRKQNTMKGTDQVFNSNALGFSYFCKERTLQENPQWMDDDNLTLVCDIEIISSPENNTAPLSKRIQNQLCEDLSNLFTDESTSDVKIKCGIRTFPCHRSILSARSPVFKAMLQADMEERRDGIIEIKDFEPDIVESMLLFMYKATAATDTVFNYQEKNRVHFVDLLKAAEKYQLDLLKAYCEDGLCCGLKVENCLISLILGDMYQAEKLKKNAMDIFIENMNKVIMESDLWKKCVRNHPDLTIEITEEIAKRKCTKTNEDA